MNRGQSTMLVPAVALLLVFLSTTTSTAASTELNEARRLSESPETAISHDTERRYRKLLAVFPFTSGRNGGEPILYYRNTVYARRIPVQLGYSHLAAFQMAMEHFNDRNPVVVPQLAALNGIDNNTATQCNEQETAEKPR